MKDGSSVIDNYIESKSGVIITRNEGRIRVSKIRCTIIKR